MHIEHTLPQHTSPHPPPLSLSRYQCFKSAWMFQVLHSGFRFPKDYPGLKTAQLVYDKEVQWTLGAILFKTRFLPLRSVGTSCVCLCLCLSVINLSLSLSCLTGTSRQSHLNRATPTGCVPPSSTTTTCFLPVSWWSCWPFCCTSSASAGSTSENRGRLRPWTCSGWRRGRLCWPDPGSV